MRRLRGHRRAYQWGSKTAIPALLGEPATAEPVAELWWGAHAAGPSILADGRSLEQAIDADPRGVLGADVVAEFRARLPYLVKLIAPAAPLSLQVHPKMDQARAGFARDEAAGISRSAPERLFADDNHKPELVFALEPFEAVVGLVSAERAAAALPGLDTPLAQRLSAALASGGVHGAVTELIDPGSRPGSEEVAETVAAVAARMATGVSPVPNTDRVLARLAEAFPGDPGAIMSLFMHPVSLQPGEALYLPAGVAHCYLSGLGLEVMANSDNVLRAGLTPKHVDATSVLASLDWSAGVPGLVVPRIGDDVLTFAPPVAEFELSVLVGRATWASFGGRGPRVLVSLDGTLEVACEEQSLPLARGQAAFVTAAQGAISMRGAGRLAHISVP